MNDNEIIKFRQFLPWIHTKVRHKIANPVAAHWPQCTAKPRMISYQVWIAFWAFFQLSDYAAGVLGQSSTETKYAFIGLANAAGTTWAWADSSPFDFTNWQTNQPDGSAPSAATITPVVKTTALTGWGWKVGGWDDNAQSSNQFAICQKSKKFIKWK